MSTSNKNNVKKFSDVNRKLTRVEVDTNFNQLKLAIDDIQSLESLVSNAVTTNSLNTILASLNNSINNKVNKIEYYQKIFQLESAIGQDTQSRKIPVIEVFTADNVTTVFKLSEIVINSDDITIYVNGTLISPDDYSIDVDDIIFNTAPLAGSTNNISVVRRIEFRYYELLSLISDISFSVAGEIGKQYYNPTEPSTYEAGTVWADSLTKTQKRRSDDNSEWIIERSLFRQSIEKYTNDEIPDSDKGPIYVTGHGAYEWTGTEYTRQTFPTGTRLLFPQEIAPIGWTQIVDDVANNRMLRVVNNNTGGNTAGTHSPIINNVVPSHTHGFSTGNNSVGHTHTVSANTGVESTDHVHTGSTHADGNHTHTTSIQSGGGFNHGGGGTPGDLSVAGGNTGQAGSHSHTFSTFGTSTNHTHYINAISGSVSQPHTHSGTTDNGSSETNWQPRYINIILCEKD